MRRVNLAFLLLFMGLLFFSCAADQIINPWSDMTHKQRSAWMNDIYNTQYDDYLVAVKKPELTEGDREMLCKKKRIFEELWPLLKTYSHYAETRQLPPEAIEAQIIGLIKQLNR